MKILMLTDKWFPLRDGFYPGGGEVVVMHTSKLLTDLGHHVTLFGPRDSEPTIHNGLVPVETWDYYSKFHYTNLGQEVPKMMSSKMMDSIRSFLMWNDVDLILSHNMGSGMIRHLSDLDIPCVFFCHNAPIYGLGSLATLEAYQYAISKGKLVASVSEWVKDLNNKTIADSTNYVNYVFVAKTDYPDLDFSFDRKRGIIVQRFVTSKTGNIGIEAFGKAGMECLLIGTPVQNPEKEVEYYKNKLLPAIEKWKATTEVMKHVPNDRVMIELGKSSVLYEGDVKTNLPFAPIEAIVMGCCVVKNKSGDGVDEIRKLLGNPDSVVSTSGLESISKEMQRLQNIPVSDRIDVAKRAREFFSVKNWEIRFNQMCSDAGVKS